MSKNPQILGLDLNCAIYHCVKKVKLPYTDENRLKWEQELIDSVIQYIQTMKKLVNPTQMLYVAVDGVAPMAKLKQQRMRRFKSAVLAEEEAMLRAQAKGVPYQKQPRWDTNSITPGTKFMENLGRCLRLYAKTSPTTIRVSPADEPGEGEQKIMEYLRTNKYNDIVIYGLDADLIVLSLYAIANQSVTIHLFREEVEMNGHVKSSPDGKESFLYLSCTILADALFASYGKSGQPKNIFLKDFVALMSILGNDFVPHGMSLKIRDEGIEKLLAIYKHAVSAPLLKEMSYNKEALQQLYKAIHEKEAQWLLKGVKNKLTARPFCASRDAGDMAVSAMNDRPIGWAAEACLLEKMELRSDWAAIYDKEALWSANTEEVTNVYLQALAWTFAYYRGESVDMYWYYPWPLPPRAETILKRLESHDLETPNAQQEPIKPLEQLAMVLPESSFDLLPQEYRQLPVQHPHAWPRTWTVYSLGRRFLWECEPCIPLIQPKQIKQWIETLYET